MSTIGVDSSHWSHMSAHSIAPVISFCTNELRFLKPCLESIRDFSSRTCIVVWDHFFDGTLENEEALFHCYKSFPQHQFILSPFVPRRIPKKFQKKIGKDFWFNCALMIGIHFSPAEYLFFLDADEILDGPAFSSWLDTGQYREYDAMRLENYWYFRSSEWQATTWEDSPVLARGGAWQKKALRCPGIRHAVFQAARRKMRHVVGLDGKPMIHHYSWVRTKEEILKKMQASAHKNENDWERLIQEEWDKPLRTKDFVHGYEFKKVKSWIEIDLTEKVHFQESRGELPPNVTVLSPHEFCSIIGIPFWRRFLRF